MSDELPPLQGGLTNEELRAALESKLRRGATYSDHDLTPFAPGIEWAMARAAQAAQPPAQPAEPTDPLHDDAYVRAIALGFPQGDARRWTLCRIADRIEAAAQQPQAHPFGWQWVPTDPTDAMVDATYHGQPVADIYRDMLAAAPQPTQPQGEDAATLTDEQIRLVATSLPHFSWGIGSRWPDALAFARAVLAAAKGRG